MDAQSHFRCGDALAGLGSDASFKCRGPLSRLGMRSKLLECLRRVRQMPFLEARLALVGRFRSYFELPLLAVSVVFRVTGSRSLSPRLIGRLTLGRRPASRQKGPVFGGALIPGGIPEKGKYDVTRFYERGGCVLATWLPKKRHFLA
jgi:hypothetical protein